MRSKEKIKVEVSELLKPGFIEEIKFPQWLTKIVPVKKKGGQIHICVDFKDLNKAYLKDEFPLPNIDILVDSAACYKLFSLMDGYSGYN